MDTLTLRKNEFAKVFIEAVSEKSVEACTKLVLSYDEQTTLLGKGGIGLTEKAYNEALTKQCQAFFKKWGSFIDEKNAHEHTKLIIDNLDKVNTYDFEINDEPFQFLETISISMKEYKKEGKIHSVGFEIDNPLFINGRFALNNMLLTKCYESFWDDLEDIPYKNKIESLDEFKELIKDIDDSDTQKEMLYAYNSSPDYWYLHDGDLELDNFDEKVNLVLTGNLTVKEPLVEIKTDLIVLGKTTANAIDLGNDNNNIFLLGGIEFNLALISDSIEPYKRIYNPNGPFLYSNIDSTIVHNPEKVKCFVLSNESDGDELQMLKAKYIDRDESDEEDEYSINLDYIIKDIKLGKNIFNDSSDVAHFVQVKKPDLNNREHIITLLKKDGVYFKELDEKYRADKELIAIAIENNEETFKYIADELKNNRDYLFSMIKNNGRLLEYVSKAYKKDKEMVLAAIDNVAYALDYAHTSLRKDKEVAMFAIKKDPSALEYVDESLQADEELLLYVIEHDVHSFKYASKSVLDNEKIILALVKKEPQYLDAEPLHRYKNDKIFVLKVLEETPSVFNYLGKKMKKDSDVLKLYKKNIRKKNEK